ncbi:hypothetical protein GOZ97_07380 [Agrobacterium vitis]|uniref:DUF3088 domain-containing protein n=2 Tax=Agrobacterium vitis TaxID=373 RepID=UPI000A86DD0F|nr:DUF3088 domain-containing protein [Agrobacterium vitis]MUZ53020.1 hypothetical protein [Agrobacterium vitis]MUZ91239.1 hypothetical protein [Agrobacterium vitis]NSX96163.1 DUF3088 domain-containing protein [Agrobacterium vitis]NSZ27302.1 DUF3088 domain-containing protein [Agrobacterium vitis]UJL77292.1 hypothetical protein AVCG678_07125 [Agrobacterium vitis]
MGRYTNQHTLDIDFIKPQAMEFDVQANAIDGGRNLINESISAEMTGGGFVTATYENCYAQQPEEHEYFNWLAAWLNGSFRFINVPLKTDWQGPFPIIERRPVPIITGIPHSDGALFSDGSGYSQATVFAEVKADAAVNSGQLTIRLYGATREIRWSDWFSIYHAAVKGWRVYRNWDVISVSVEGTTTVSGASLTYRDYVLAIQPALREAVTVGTRVEFARPRFVAKIAPGQKISTKVESFWVTRPTLQFVEAF